MTKDTMTVKEALEQRVPRIRKEEWGEVSYLRLPLLADGTHSAWAELYDEPGQRTLDVRPGSQRLCVLFPEVSGDGGFVPYTGEPSPYEQDPQAFARVYSEG